MGLNILNFFNFFNMPPKIPYLFDVVFSTWGANANKYIPPSWSVQSVKLPVMEAADNEFNIFLGDGRVTVPLWNPASRTLEITFEETDDMKITKFINTLAHEQYVKGLIHYVAIRVTDYQPTVPFALTYICRLKDYTDVQFANGGSANVGTVTASFIVIAALDSNDESSINKVLEENRKYSLNNGIADFNDPVIEPPGKNLETDPQKFTKEKYKSDDLIFDDDELRKQVNEIMYAMTHDLFPNASKLPRFNDTPENRERLFRLLKYNAKLTAEKVELFRKDAEAQGIKIKVNEFNGVLKDDLMGTVHALEMTDRGSHTFNAKVDLQNINEGEGGDVSPEQKAKLNKIAANHGLILNWETRTRNSQWADTAVMGALVPEVDSDGNIIDAFDVFGNVRNDAKRVSKPWVPEGQIQIVGGDKIPDDQYYKDKQKK